MDGVCVCVFLGVNTRALDELFRRSVERSREYSDVITVTILEVYNEEIRDLLVEGGGAERCAMVE